MAVSMDGEEEDDMRGRFDQSTSTTILSTPDEGVGFGGSDGIDCSGPGVGSILRICNAIRLQAATLPPSTFLRQFLQSHEKWRQFLPKLVAVTLKQQHPGMGIPLPGLHDDMMRDSFLDFGGEDIRDDLGSFGESEPKNTEFTVEQVNLGSEYASMMGFEGETEWCAEDTPMLSKAKKSRSARSKKKKGKKGKKKGDESPASPRAAENSNAGVGSPSSPDSPNSMSPKSPNSLSPKSPNSAAEDTDESFEEDEDGDGGGDADDSFEDDDGVLPPMRAPDFLPRDSMDEYSKTFTTNAERASKVALL